MNLRSHYITILLLFFVIAAMGQSVHTLEKTVNVELEWNSFLQSPKVLKTKVNKRKTIKEEIPSVSESQFTEKQVNPVPDTIFWKDFESPKKLKIQFSVKPLVSSKILKSSSFVFKDNATNNIVYQDLAHGFFTNSTTCFEQDNKGYVWIGSETDGLCKYDGFNYEIYDRASFIPSNNIDELLYDTEGNLWVGTTSGICYIKDQKLYLLEIPGIENPNVTKIIQDSKGAIWVGTAKQGAIKIENGLAVVYNKNTGFPFNSIHGIHHDKDGNYWIGLGGYLGFIRFDNEKILHYKPEKNKIGVFQECFFEDEQGIWIGQRNGGLLVFKNDSFWRYEFLNPEFDKIYSIKKNEKGIWFISYGGGVVNLNKGKVKYYNAKHGLPGRHPYGMLLDNNDNIWVSDLIDGIGRINENMFSVSDAPIGRTPNIVSDNKGNTWFCQNGSEFVKETKAGTYEGIYNQHDKNFPKVRFIWDAVFTENDEIWLTTYSWGCVYFSEKEYVFYTFPDLGEFGNVLYAAEEDKNGNIWFTSRETGLIKYNGSNFVLFNTSNGLTSNKTNQLFTDSKGRLWVGTDNAGVNIIEGGKVAIIDDLRNSTISSFYEDKDGNIWIGTEGEGAYVLKDNTLYNIQEKHGVISNNIRSFIQDDEGRIWMATAKGISQLNFSDDLNYSIRNFGKEVGNFLVDFTPAVHKYKDGRIIWGTSDKVVSFNPKNERKELKAPKIIIKNYKIEGEQIKEFNVDNTIQVPSEKELSLMYTALDWGYEDDLYFEYALVKLNDNKRNWISHKRNTSISLKNIPTGKYELYVKAVGVNGIAVSDKITINFKPFWWETFWFKIVVAVLVLISFFMIYKQRTKKLLKRQLELEGAVIEKTAIIEQEKETLKEHNVIIETQKKEIGVLLEEVNHRVKNNLTMLTSLLYFQEKQIESSEAKIALQDGINRIKAISTIHEKLHKYDNHTKIGFKEYIEDLIQSIESSLASKDKVITTEVRCDNIEVEVSKSVYLALIINELITNSYKYAFSDLDEGVIGVSMQINENGKFELKVYDNGSGLQQGWEKQNLASTGLNLVKMLTQQLDAEMIYTNTNFSTFTFVF